MALYSALSSPMSLVPWPCSPRSEPKWPRSAASARRAPADEARTWMGPFREAGRLGPAAMATIFIAGLWMMALRCGAQAWIIAALVGLVVMAVLGAVLTRAALGRL